VVRNALDHGIESAAERRDVGKSTQGCLRLTTQFVNDDLVIDISDDGRGIAFDLLRVQAIKAGLPHARPCDLIEAAFHDGVTTKREVSEFSGRGIGMGAVRMVCERMGGAVEISSTRGPWFGSCGPTWIST
jgi:chemotaxis protein histidine kinase CheA